MDRISAKELVAQANEEITTHTVEDVKNMLGNDGVVLVDVRDSHELEEGGCIAGAIQASRGMLEFYVDPDMPYFRPVFGQDKEFVLY